MSLNPNSELNIIKLKFEKEYIRRMSQQIENFKLKKYKKLKHN